MKHKHADLIKQWADGAKIETRLSDGNWYEISLPNWGSWDSEFRVKPDINKTVQPVGVACYNGEVVWEDSKNPPVGTILYALKSAEVL